MRMWMIDPELLCRQHLLGEHVELHMLAGALLKQRSIAGYLARGQLEPTRLYRRHNALVREMLRRGMRHRSALPSVRLNGFRSRYVDVEASRQELRRRCQACRARIDEAAA